MFDSYQDIFEQRGAMYHEAMRLYPRAREEEFNQIVRIADTNGADVICDIPAGGGYLKSFLRTNAEVLSVEPSPTFAKLCKVNGNPRVMQAELHSLCIKSRTADRILSLAGLHHVIDKTPFYREAHRILKADGMLCIAEVRRHSRVSLFLDGFVHEHSPMGHRGDYLDHGAAQELERIGFDVCYSPSVQYHWRFDSLEDMAVFVRLLFGVMNASNEEILDGLQRYLGYVTLGEEYGLEWELAFYQARKKPRS